MKRDPSLIPLSHQHHHTLGLAVAIRRSSEAGMSGEVCEQLRENVLAAWSDELKTHFEVEEAHVFPLAVAWTEEAEMVESLISDHRRLATLVEIIRGSDIAELPEVLLEFGEFLTAHVRREERELFESMQLHIPNEQLAVLGARIGPLFAEK